MFFCVVNAMAIFYFIRMDMFKRVLKVFSSNIVLGVIEESNNLNI